MIAQTIGEHAWNAGLAAVILGATVGLILDHLADRRRRPRPRHQVTTVRRRCRRPPCIGAPMSPQWMEDRRRAEQRADHDR